MAISHYLRWNEHPQQVSYPFPDVPKQWIHHDVGAAPGPPLPKDPKSSPLLCTAKEGYFGRISVGVYPGKPGYEEARWINSEDVNIEHLLDLFTTVDMDLNSLWDVCSYFLEHLYWHKPRLVLLGPKIEALPDVHPSKPRCLFWLSQLFDLVGNLVECKRLLIHTLTLWREWGDKFEVGLTLRQLADANRRLGLHKEGIQQVEEALKVNKQLNDISGQAYSLLHLALLLHTDSQLSAAEEAASQSIGLLPEKFDEHLICACHRVLGEIHSSKGEVEKAIDHLEVALRIASSLDWHYEQFWAYYCLAKLYCYQGRFGDSLAHVERAKSLAANDMYLSCRATHLQAFLWYKQNRFGEARLEVLRAIDVYEKIGATTDLEMCRNFIRDIEKAMEERTSPHKSDLDGELLDPVLLATHINLLF